MLQSVTLQKTIQSLELNSKQKQELSNCTVTELGERLDKVALECAKKDQQTLSLRNEVDCLFREKNTKVSYIISSNLSLFITYLYLQDVLITSLEADLAICKMFQAPTSHDSLRVETLQRSVSIHEVAMVSLKKELVRQKEELVASQEDVSKLQALLDKKVGVYKGRGKKKCLNVCLLLTLGRTVV